MSFLVMKCCHLYEIKAHKALRTVAARNAKLTALDLLYSNDFCNLITTCEMCHVDFDAYKIGGFALDHNRCRDWRFAILNILQESSWSHGRPIQYNRPLAVLEDRMVHIVSKNCYKIWPIPRSTATSARRLSPDSLVLKRRGTISRHVGLLQLLNC